MDQRSRNDDYSRVNTTRKNIQRSIFHPINGNANAIPQPQQPQPQVYIINKNDFKSFVQQVTSNYHQSCERLSQNSPKRQKTRPEPIKQTSSAPTNATTVQDDPHVSLYMRCLQSLLDDSSESYNGDQSQQPFYEYESQPQVPKQLMTCSNDLEPVMNTTTLTSTWFDDGLPQQMDGANSLEYPQPLTPNFTFSSMNQVGVFYPDLELF
ncbi:unnamed protein product [Microthlaspi erraticum]|uniref:VQ domain-containing protein n=1 Tax=Microthlaspi erraticum TaxID=1685480 RepID=A0A6D2IEQ2_9BRAS|nr:unnamed protein product [Microthlaspi erraticum]